MGIRVYRNLHKQTWSCQMYEKGKGWRLWEHIDVFTAPSATFKVYDTGRQRVRDEGKKYVHAYAIVPYLTAWDLDRHYWFDITYNPYNDLGFHDAAQNENNLAGVKECRFGKNGHIKTDGIVYP